MTKHGLIALLAGLLCFAAAALGMSIAVVTSANDSAAVAKAKYVACSRLATRAKVQACVNAQAGVVTKTQIRYLYQLPKAPKDWQQAIQMCGHMEAREGSLYIHGLAQESNTSYGPPPALAADWSTCIDNVITAANGGLAVAGTGASGKVALP